MSDQVGSLYHVNFIRFANKAEARKFCKSKRYDEHMAGLRSQLASLADDPDRTLHQFNHGAYSATQAEETSAWVQQEIERFRSLKDYFNRVPAEAGYVWVYDNNSYGRAFQKLNLEGADQTHPVFKKYVRDYQVPEKDIGRAFGIWYKGHTGGINDAFKMAYTFSIEKMIPEGTKMFDIRKKK